MRTRSHIDTITNMDLVTKPRSKSVVWLYFGLKADDKGQPLNNREAVCRLCRKIVLAKSGNTTNLRSHLKRRHRADFFDTPSSTSSGGFETPGLDLNNEEFFEDVPLLQSVPGHSSYVPDAVLPPGEPWLQGGPSRARLSLPSCLSLSEDAFAGSSSEDQPADVKVFAKCLLQQGVMFGPFVGELCRGQTPSSLRYAWAIRDDAAFIYIDASDENKSNWMRYVTYTGSEEKHNLVVFQFYRHIYYRVSQPIAEGAELRVWIGKDYASLLGLGMGDSVKCGVGDKESALRLLQDVQLVTLPEPSAAPLWSDRSQSQSPMPVISDVTTVSAADGAPASPFPSGSLLSFPSPSYSVTEKYDFMPGTERLLSNPGATLSNPWYFFGFEPDPTGRPLDRGTAVCKLCLEHVGCASGAADLQSHLTSKHDIRPRDSYKDRGSSAAQQRPQPAPASSSSVNALPVVSSAPVTSAIVNFLITDLQPPALIEGDGFRQLIHTMLPFYKELPSPDQLEALLKDHHTRAKANLFHLLRRRGEVEDLNDYTAPIESEPRSPWHSRGSQSAVGHSVTLSVDVWRHSWQGGTEHYLTLWAHFIDCNFSFHNLALATRRLAEGEQDSFQAVESRVKAVALEWGISQPSLVLLGGQWKNRARRPVQGGDAAGSAPHPNSTTFLEREDSTSPDEASELGPSGEGLPSIPCFFSAVRGCVEEVMLHPVVSKTLRQFQLFLSALFLPPAHSKGWFTLDAQIVLQVLTKQEKADLKSWAHSWPAWKKLYPLLSTLVKHKSVFVDLVKDIKDEVLPPEDVESSSSGSCSAISTSNSSSVGVSVSPSDWRVVEDLSLVLKPLDVACRTLAKESFPRLSLIKPILTGLLSRHLVSRPADSSSVLKEVKKTMRRHLSSCYGSPAVSRALSVACCLDPQFHGLRFMEEKEQAATFDWLKEETARIVKEDRRGRGKKRSPSPGSPESDSDCLRRSKRLKESRPISFKETSEEEEESDVGDPDESEAAEPGCQGALSGMEFLLGDLFSPAPSSRHSSVEEALDMEMSVFRAGRGASLGVEPLQWWRTKAGQFPLLAAAARAYLAAPAAAGNAALDFVEDGASSRKRSNIPPESLDAILFLHYNNIPVTESSYTTTTMMTMTAAAVKSEDKSSGS
ncbi:uncharacterized protein LOC115391013 [Salarias fasciatus]|uniref:uncharacterized protein LOC115391013 n=1 Tax=Salarias fasciatus TaxID=181472 RepID=UPI001176A015|nr:uncharacterized protein LOC115391013 [Salarias fasciatus]